MKFIMKDQLYRKLKNKQVLEMNDLIEIIEGEFNVSVRIEQRDQDEFNVTDLARDPDVIRQMETSHEDMKAGRTYTGQEGLKVLEQAIREYERESNL